MNSDQLLGILRAFIPGTVAILMRFGIGTDDQDTLIMTAIATALVAGWSAYTNKPGTVIAPTDASTVITKSSPTANVIVTANSTVTQPK